MSDRFFSHLRFGEWAKVREELAALPPDWSRKVYDNILADLAEKQKPNLKLDDALGLAAAVPGDFTADNLRKLGQLFSLTAPPNEAFWLADKLRQGTATLGGADPAKRLLAGRVLLAGGFKDLARAYLPAVGQLAQIADEGVRAELPSFLATQQETEAAQRGQAQKIWDENLRLLARPRVNEREKSKAGTALAKVLMQGQPGTLAPVFIELLKSNPDSAMRLVAGLQPKVQSEARGEDGLRTENLKAQGPSPRWRRSASSSSRCRARRRRT